MSIALRDMRQCLSPSAASNRQNPRCVGRDMKRVTLFTAALALALPAPALAFHHTHLPATVCHAPAAGSPSNDNGMAKEALLAAGQTLPLPPIVTPGDGQGHGGENFATEPED